MKASNGMHMITVGSLTGPWHVASTSHGLKHDRWGLGRMQVAGSWHVVNMLTGKSKIVGPVRMKGTNYFDRAKEVAEERNDQFFKEHHDRLPMYLGINEEFDKVITLVLQRGLPEGKTIQMAFNEWRGL